MRATWVRFHTLPRECRQLRPEFWTARLRHTYARSKARYDATPDGEWVAEYGFKMLSGEVGRYEGVRFIEDKQLPGLPA